MTSTTANLQRMPENVRSLLRHNLPATITICNTAAICDLWEWHTQVAPVRRRNLGAALYGSALPGNAPQGFDALDRGVFDVLERQTSWNFGPVHTQTDLHWPRSHHWWCRETHNLRHGPPVGKTKGGIYSCLWLWLPAYCCRGKSLTSCSYEPCTLPWGERIHYSLSHLLLVTDTLGMEHCN